MRRFAPWLTTGLLGALAAAAALGSSGVAGPSPSAWVHQLLARTEGARTAHFSVTLSVPGPHGPRAAALWSTGEVDFANGSSRRVAVSGASTALHPVAVQIGDREYADTPRGWVVYSLPDLPGSTTVDGVLGVLASLATPTRAQDVRWLGVGQVDGASATGYRVDFRPTCSTGIGAITSVEVWVDGSGRLVMGTARDEVPIEVPPQDDVQGFPDHVRHRTLTETIRFTDFGAPVAIAAPRDIPASTMANGGLNAFYPCEP